MKGINAKNWTLLDRDGRLKCYGCDGCKKACSTKSTAHPQRCIIEPEVVEISFKVECTCLLQTPVG